MAATTTPEKVRFTSGDTTCAAWHYPGTNGGCVVMASGTAVTKEPGTDRFAQRFNAAGFSVLAFDFRHLGESGGEPRQTVSVREQQADYQAAIEFARTLPGVDPQRIAIWGFSLAGGHVLPVGARNPWLAAAIAQTPLADARAAAPNAIRHATLRGFLRMTGRGLIDATIGRLRREPMMVPLAAAPGTVASLNTPDSLDGGRALNPGNRYPGWRQEVAARSLLWIGFYRPSRAAARVESPLLVVVCDDDQSALAEPAARAAERAPHGELVRLPGSHYAPFLEAHEQAVEAELAFLRRHLTPYRRFSRHPDSSAHGKRDRESPSPARSRNP
jgi:uncharacterized protein